MVEAHNLQAPQYDAVVIGAGFAGLYQLHCLAEIPIRESLGNSCRIRT